MKIKFIQKTTLVDFPGEIACTIFSFGCPFRCGFCYNPSLVTKENTPDISEKEVLEFLEKRKDQLTGVCFTGGEPLLNIDLELIKKIRSLDYKIKIDTNGSFPDKLEKLIKENLVDYVAMDIKNSKEKYLETINMKIDLNKIEKSIKLISQLENYEFRTTIVESIHSEKDILEMFTWLNSLTNKRIKNYSLQGFKNKGEFIDEKFKEQRETSKDYLEKLKKIGEPFCESIVVKY